MFRSPPPPLSSDNRRLLWLILLTAFFIRTAYFWSLAPSAFVRFPLVHDQSDMYAFWQWAQSILKGDWLGRIAYHPDFAWRRSIAPPEDWHRWWGKTVFHQAPAYPYFLALAGSVSNSPLFATAIQLLAGSLHPLVIFALARRLFDDRTGLVAAALCAAYGPFVFFEGALLRDWLPPVLEPLILVTLLRAMEADRTSRWLAVGLAMGLATLTKETALAVIVLSSVWMALEFRRQERFSLRPYGLIAAGFILCLSPLFARNMIVGAPVTAISIQGPANVLLGLSAAGPPTGYDPKGISRSGREQAAKGYLHAVLEGVRTHGGDSAALLRHQVLKILALADPREISSNISYAYGEEVVPLLRWLIGYGILFPLGISGLILGRRYWPRAQLVYWYAAAAFGVQMITFILSRFRLAFVPILILGTAVWVTLCVERLRAGERRSAAAVALLPASLFIIQFLAFPPPAGPDFVAMSAHLYAGQVYAQDGRCQRTLEEVRVYREAQTRSGWPPDRDAAAKAGALEGDCLLMQGLESLAKGHRQEARLRLSLAERAYADVPNLPLTNFNLGAAYADLGEAGKVRTYLGAFLEREREGPRAEEAREILSALPESGGAPAGQP